MKFFFLLWFIVILAVSLPAAATGDDFISKEKKFIMDLYAGSMYFDCITETRRLMHYDPGARDNPGLFFFIESLYFLGGQYKTVVYNINSSKRGSDLAYAFLLSQAYQKLGMSTEGFRVLEGFDYTLLNSDDAYNLMIRKTEVLLQKKEYSKILHEIAAVKTILAPARDTGDLEKDVSRYLTYGFKSQAVACVLSALVPGSGQIYAGKYWQGVLSFLSVAATVTGAYFAYEYGQKEIAYTLMVFSGVFYAGNIYGAYNAAMNKNFDLHARLRGEVTKKHIPEYRPITDDDVEKNFK